MTQTKTFFLRIKVFFCCIKTPFTSVKSNAGFIFCRFRLKPGSIIHIMLRFG